MALSRTALLLFLLPVPATVYLAASIGDVNANAQCLPSAEAVRQQYPGSWASWTMRAADHKGQRCWFPVMRESRARHVEAALRRAAERLVSREEHKPDTTTPVERPADPPVIFAAEMNTLGWSFRTRSATVGPVVSSNDADAPESTFDDRFAAAGDMASIRRPSAIQRMMDPVGAIPDTP